MNEEFQSLLLDTSSRAIALASFRASILDIYSSNFSLNKYVIEAQR